MQGSNSITNNNLLRYKKIWFIFIFLLTNCLVVTNSYSCTIFYTANNGIILAGNNEDWSDPDTHMWFYPASETTHGWVKFGFGSGFPQGGMNDHGLFWDATAGPYLAMPYSEENKTLYDGPLMQKVIEESANIAETLEIFNQYYCQDQYKAQYLLGDSSGTSMIVEGDNVILNENGFQVLTNFYQSHPDLGGYPCWRYETAVDHLENCDSITTWLAGTILSATHQDGNYPTQYSNIYDLKEGIIHLFYYHNYDEFLVINLQDELEKGYKSYTISNIFSEVTLLSPANDEEINGSSATLKWKGLPDSQYEILLSKTPDFTETLIFCDNHFEDQLILNTTATIFFPAILLFSIFLLIKRGKIWYLLPACICFCLLVNCDKEEDSTNKKTDSTIEFSETFDGLEQDTTYYWKIKSSSGHTDNFQTETITRSFKTLSNFDH